MQITSVRAQKIPLLLSKMNWITWVNWVPEKMSLFLISGEFPVYVKCNSFSSDKSDWLIWRKHKQENPLNLCFIDGFIRINYFWQGETVGLLITYYIFIKILKITLTGYLCKISQYFRNIVSRAIISHLKEKTMSLFRKQQMNSLGRLLEITPRVFRWLSKFIINEKFAIFVLHEVEENIVIIHFVDWFLFSTLFHLLRH